MKITARRSGEKVKLFDQSNKLIQVIGLFLLQQGNTRQLRTQASQNKIPIHNVSSCNYISRARKLHHNIK